jgi:hypothetical protein
MTSILVDHAKANRRAKRGGGAAKVSLKGGVGGVALFRRADLRRGRVPVKISPATADRELKLAKAWLYQTLNEPGTEEAGEQSGQP